MELELLEIIFPQINGNFPLYRKKSLILSMHGNIFIAHDMIIRAFVVSRSTSVQGEIWWLPPPLNQNIGKTWKIIFNSRAGV
jgi:hypothetical protein